MQDRAWDVAGFEESYTLANVVDEYWDGVSGRGRELACS